MEISHVARALLVVLVLKQENTGIWNVDGFLVIKSKDGYLGDPEGNCSITSTTLTCSYIPKVIPTNISTVVVLQHHGSSFSGEFKDASWKTVHELRVSSQNVKYISDNQLDTLNYLRAIHLSLPEFRLFTSKAFVGLRRLKIFSLTEMSGLDISTLEKALYCGDVLPALEVFTFNSGNNINVPIFTITDKFKDFILKSPVRKLNMSNVIIHSPLELLFVIGVKIDVLNVSDSYLVPADAILNKSSSVRLSWKTPKPLLTTADVSGLKTPILQNIVNGSNNSEHTSSKRLLLGQYQQIDNWVVLVENIYINRISPHEFIYTECNNFTNVPVLTKSVHARENNLVRIEGTFVFNETNQIRWVDLSYNKLEFINPGLFSTAIHMEYLDLSHNRLYNMQNQTEFSDLFRPLGDLVQLLLVGNNISFIPCRTFHYNGKLVKLDLGYNALDSIVFDLSGLVSLETLDIRYNRIHVIEGRNLSLLMLYVDMRQEYPSGVDIILEGNPIECICSSVKFLKWLYKYSLSRRRRQMVLRAMKCSYQGHIIEVDNSAIERTKFLCYKGTVIICSGIAAVCLAAFVVLIFFIIRKTIKRKKDLTEKEKFRIALNDGTTEQKYIVFVAYSGDDEELVWKVLLLKLKREVSAQLMTNKKTICTGHDFQPGYPIVNETFRLVKLSFVFVAVVSESFCRSEYCMAEIQRSMQTT